MSPDGRHVDGSTMVDHYLPTLVSPLLFRQVFKESSPQVWIHQAIAVLRSFNQLPKLCLDTNNICCDPKILANIKWCRSPLRAFMKKAKAILRFRVSMLFGTWSSREKEGYFRLLHFSSLYVPFPSCCPWQSQKTKSHPTASDWTLKALSFSWTYLTISKCSNLV